MENGRNSVVCRHHFEDEVKRLLVNRIRAPSFSFAARTPIKDVGESHLC